MRAPAWAGLVGTPVRGIFSSIRSCELQTLAPRLPPFTDTPHPPSVICWASHELAGVGMIGRCVTAQPACAYTVPSCPGRYTSCFRRWHRTGCGGLAGSECTLRMVCLVSLHPECRFARSQIIFFWLPRRCCRIGIFFSSLLFHSVPLTNPKHFSTFLPEVIVAGTALLLSASASARSRSHSLPRLVVVTRITLLSRLQSVT